MRIIGLIVLLFFIAMFGIGQVLYEDKGSDYDIYNLTNHLKWNSSKFQPQNYTNTTMDRIGNIITKLTDFVGYSSFEIAKFGVEYGFQHPEIDYLQLLEYVRYIVIIWVVSLLFPMLIPLIALIYITVLGVKKLINWIKSKRFKND